MLRLTIATAALLAAATTMPIAAAQPGCTASNMSLTLGNVSTQTGTWLSAHPEAEAVVNSADEGAIRNYFATHAEEWNQLRGLAAPLRALRERCPQQVNSADVARLFDAMAS